MYTIRKLLETDNVILRDLLLFTFLIWKLIRRNKLLKLHTAFLSYSIFMWIDIFFIQSAVQYVQSRIQIELITMPLFILESNKMIFCSDNLNSYCNFKSCARFSLDYVWIHYFRLIFVKLNYRFAHHFDLQHSFIEYSEILLNLCVFCSKENF